MHEPGSALPAAPAYDPPSHVPDTETPVSPSYPITSPLNLPILPVISAIYVHAITDVKKAGTRIITPSFSRFCPLKTVYYGGMTSPPANSPSEDDPSRQEGIRYSLTPVHDGEVPMRVDPPFISGLSEGGLLLVHCHFSG
jgi:hypothetical protein